jgi:hypothetical protein
VLPEDVALAAHLKGTMTQREAEQAMQNLSAELLRNHVNGAAAPPSAQDLSDYIVGADKKYRGSLLYLGVYAMKALKTARKVRVERKSNENGHKKALGQENSAVPGAPTKKSSMSRLNSRDFNGKRLPNDALSSPSHPPKKAKWTEEEEKELEQLRMSIHCLQRLLANQEETKARRLNGSDSASPYAKCADTPKSDGSGDAHCRPDPVLPEVEWGYSGSSQQEDVRTRVECGGTIDEDLQPQHCVELSVPSFEDTHWLPGSLLADDVCTEPESARQMDALICVEGGGTIDEDRQTQHAVRAPPCLAAYGNGGEAKLDSLATDEASSDPESPVTMPVTP